MPAGLLRKFADEANRWDGTTGPMKLFEQGDVIRIKKGLPRISKPA